MLELATSSDRDAVNVIAGQIHAMHVVWRPDIYEMIPEQYTPERFLDAVNQRQLYVAKLSGVVVGYAHIKIRDYDWPGVVKRKAMLVDAFGVLEGCRGRGIGKIMMEDIHALAKAFGCTDLQLQVYPQNDGAVDFYQKCGFMIHNIGMQKKV